VPLRSPQEWEGALRLVARKWKRAGNLEHACKQAGRCGSVAVMARAGFVAWALVLSACPDNPYVLGRLQDAQIVQTQPSSDAGSTSAADGAVVVASECSVLGATALVCEGFERSELASAPGEFARREGAGEFQRSTARAHRGSASLHATTTAPESVAVVGRSFDAVQAGELHVRVHVFIPSAQPTEIMNVLFVGDGQPVSPFEGIDVNLSGGALQLFAQPDQLRQTSAVSVPRDVWFCLRMQVTLDHVRGAAQLFVDDQRALASEPFDSLPTEGVDQVRVGVDWSSEQDERFEIYFDDLVVSRSAVSCLD
jgi:hypothetical protein